MEHKKLYEQEACPNCGKQKLKVAGFCPHCGHVRSEGGWTRFWRELSSAWKRPETGQAPPVVVSVVIGLVVAGIVLYQVLLDRSFEGVITALVALFLLLQTLIRAWKKGKKGEEEGDEGQKAVLTVEERNTSAAEEPGQRFYCEDCGAEVGPDALACPKCGLKFGGQG